MNLQFGVAYDVRGLVGICREIAWCLLNSGAHGFSNGLALPGFLFVCVLMHVAGPGWGRICTLRTVWLGDIGVGVARTFCGDGLVVKTNLVAVEVDGW